MALIAAHLIAGVILVVTVQRLVYNLPLPPLPYPLPPLLPVPNKPYGFCRRYTPSLLTLLRSCVKVEVDVLGFLSLIVLMVSVDVKQH